ncbi:MAG: maleylpyruvate isomerase family mycothiol-dependent enzyme [Acidimicrobiales bacterium]
MDLRDAVDTIGSAGTAIIDAGRASPDGPVATCPGWTVMTVVKHVGGVHRWAAAVLVAPSPDEPPAFPKADRSLDGPALLDWADEARHVLLATLAHTDPERPVWAFGPTRPARFWWRRQAHETAIHAWDATMAVGERWSMPTDVAADGIDELLEWALPRRWADAPPLWGRDRTIHLHRTDGEGEWLIRLGAVPAVERGHAKGDLAVRGPAVELLAWASNRSVPGAAGVELFGDVALAEDWKAHVAF